MKRPWPFRKKAPEPVPGPIIHYHLYGKSSVDGRWLFVRNTGGSLPVALDELRHYRRHGLSAEIRLDVIDSRPYDAP